MKSHLIRKLFFLALPLAAAGAGIALWNEVDDLTQPILVPTNASYRGSSVLPKKAAGLRLEPFTFTGWDDAPVQAVIARREGEESSRQLSILGNLAAAPAERLHALDYVLVCVDWDHGIRSALPLAESLTAAGLTCVLWEPRGSDARRPYCTHGLREYRDVPLLIDSLSELSEKEEPVVVAVGQGYGAGLLLRAASREPRLRGLVSIDAYASLQQSVLRTLPDSLLAPVTLMLMDMRIKRTVGMECFDVAPVECAADIRRGVPVLVLQLAQHSLVSTLADALNIDAQLRTEHHEVWTLRDESDPPGAETRIVYRRLGRESGRGDSAGRVHRVPVELRLCRDEDAALADVVHWLDRCVVDAVLAPRVEDPDRPKLGAHLHL
ncbi:MAG: hypothetical protein ACI4O9_04400 [Akkermansia sp.]